MASFMEYTSFIVGFKVRNLGNYLVELVDFRSKGYWLDAGIFSCMKSMKVAMASRNLMPFHAIERGFF
jgi:hypothetical protein